MMLGFREKNTPYRSSIVRARLRATAIMVALTRQDNNMNKHERWTEQDIDALPLGEHDYFERKSGQLYDNNQGGFLDIVAKEISAFANSGGGHLILGVADDGTPDGILPMVGSTSMKDWLEQKIPNL